MGLGLTTAATIVGAFVFGVPSIIAVVINYVKRGEARGTYLESHFRWQIRTFWFGLLWVSLCMLFIVFTLGVGILIAWIPLGGVGLWFIYRIARGWLALMERRPAGSGACRWRGCGSGTAGSGQPPPTAPAGRTRGSRRGDASSRTAGMACSGR